MDSREQLIGKLAASFGMDDGRTTRYSESKYDASTGTLYCEGVTIPKSTIIKALEYYERQKDYYKRLSLTDKNMMESYLYACVSYNAISMLMLKLKE